MVQGFDKGLTDYGDRDFSRFLRRSFARSMGLSTTLLNAPVIGIAATPSGFNNCHRGVPELVEAVSRGVLAAGGLPRPFPTVSLGEVFLSPTSMVYRNLMAMDTEEMIGAQPMDAVVHRSAAATRPCRRNSWAPLRRTCRRSSSSPDRCRPGAIAASGSAPAPTAARSGRKYRAGGIDSDEIETDRGTARCHGGHLRRHGHGEHHGLHHRGARHVVAGHRRDPRRPRRPARRRRVRPVKAGRETGAHQEPHPAEARSSPAKAIENADPRADGGRRLDQRRRPPRRHRGAASACAMLESNGSTRFRTRRPCWSI